MGYSEYVMWEVISIIAVMGIIAGDILVFSWIYKNILKKKD